MAANDPELDRLLERAQRGDADAWNALVALLKDLVYTVPRRYHLGADDAADVFMATFQALHRNLDRIENGHSLPRWLAVVAGRESLRLRRLKERTVTDLPLDEVVAEEERDAESEAVHADDGFRVRRALARLPLRCRTLLGALYYDEESSYSEIAARLNVPVGAIGPTRARCLERLRRLMEDEGFFG